MTDLRDLYQEVILDHNRRPRNFREMPGATCQADGHNPLCGDNVTIFLQLDGDGVVTDVSFVGTGCAISKASASLMTETIKGKSRDEVEALFASFHAMVTGQGDATAADVGKLKVLAGVSEFPVRVKCATLPWHTLQAAVRGEDEPVTTE